MLCALSVAHIEFLLVGAYAVAAHGHPRATGDLDLWVRPDTDTAPRVYRVLADFGAPLHDLTIDDLAKPGIVFQIEVEPSRIDILTAISGFVSSQMERTSPPVHLTAWVIVVSCCNMVHRFGRCYYSD